MLLHHLLTEAPVKPGERKQIDLRFSKVEQYESLASKYKVTISNLEYLLRKLERNNLLANSSGYIDQLNAIVNNEVEILDKKSKDEFVRFENIIKGIKKNCREIVKVYQDYDQFLYRGMKNSSDAVYGKPFDQRRARDSSQDYSDIFNEMLKKAGILARRDNITFCTSDRTQTEQYGNTYIIFPRDGFSCTVSENQKDFVFERGNANLMFDKTKLLELHKELIQNTENANNINPTWAKDARMQSISAIGTTGFFGGSWFYHQKQIIEAANSGKIPAEYAERVNTMNLITPEAIIKNFELVTDDIGRAIELEHEVMITGPYFAISGKYERHVKEMLGMKS